MAIVRSNSSPAIFDLTKVANNQADQASQATSSLKYKGKAGVAIAHDVKYAFQKLASALKFAGNTVKELAVAAALYTGIAAKKTGETAESAVTSVKSGSTSILAKFKDALKSVYGKTILGRVATLEKEAASLRWQVNTLNKNVDPSVSKEVEQRNNFYAVKKDIEKGKATLKPTVTTIKTSDIELGKVIENGNLTRIIREASAATKAAASYNAEPVVDQAVSAASNGSRANNNLAVVLSGTQANNAPQVTREEAIFEQKAKVAARAAAQAQAANEVDENFFDAEEGNV
jgi:hypothetical protein